MKSSEKPSGTERYPQYALLLALLLTCVAYQAYQDGLISSTQAENCVASGLIVLCSLSAIAAIGVEGASDNMATRLRRPLRGVQRHVNFTLLGSKNLSNGILAVTALVHFIGFELSDGFISTQTENCVASGRHETLCYRRTLGISSLIVLFSLSAIAATGVKGHVKFTLLDSNNHWNRILMALVHFIGLELSDRFISTQTENCVASGRNETLCYRRTLGISSLIVLFSLSAIAATGVEGASDNHGNTPPPPPSWRTMAHEHFSFRQQESLEQDLHGFRSLYRDVDHCMDNAINTLMRIEGEAKVLRQRLQELRYGKQNQFADHHPRLEAAGPAGEAQTIYEEVTGPTHKLNLCFHGSLKSRIYTNSPLLAQNNEGIEIAIYRDGQIITSGHLSSLRVEIVALESDHSCKGDWTEEDFDGQIRKRRDGPG